jgi:hypothetical protein
MTFWQQLNINIKIFMEETPVTRLDNYHLFYREESCSWYSENLQLSTKPQTVPWLNGLVAWSQGSHSGCPSSIPSHFRCNSWWTKWQFDRLPSSVLRASSVIMIPPMLHTPMSFFYHRRYIILETETFDTETLLSLTKSHGVISQKAVVTHLFCLLQNNNY